MDDELWMMSYGLVIMGASSRACRTGMGVLFDSRSHLEGFSPISNFFENSDVSKMSSRWLQPRVRIRMAKSH